MSERGFLGISHTPLMGKNPIDATIESGLQNALADARARVREFAPELVILVAPDHYNGFFNELMPAFCIGAQASAVGDYGTLAGELHVDKATALALADSLLEDGFDLAVSHRMRVDHGFAQPLEILWGSLDTPPIVPLFVNAVSPPTIPRAFRCRQIGTAIGAFLDRQGRKTLLIGSGGLSHEPPVPTMNHPDPAVRERITTLVPTTQQEQEARTQRVLAAGRALASGDPSIKALNPNWDKRWMQAIAGQESSLDDLGRMTDNEITQEAGRSGHESKNWLIARSALKSSHPTEISLNYYQAIPEYIAGFGVMFIEQQHKL